MRGAYVCSDRGVPVFGSKGCSLHVQEVTRAFTQCGIDISLFASAIGDSCPPDLATLDVHKVKHAKLKDRQLREQSDIRDNNKTIRELEHSGPFDFVYERYSLWSHAGMSFAHESGIPAILEVNAPLIEEQKQYRGLIDEVAAEQVTRQCFQSASVILAVSDEVGRYVQSYKEAEGKVHVLPNGVNTERFSSVHSGIHPSDHDFTIGFVGTLKPWHGVEGLLESFCHLHRDFPKARLLIVGDGPQREVIQDYINGHQLEQVVDLVGAVPTDQVAKYYELMDVGVAPYPESEHFYFSPLKVYEYMAAGLPVIASDIGQIKEVVAQDVSGSLYSAGNIGQLTHALEFYLTHPEARQHCGAQARQIATEYHSWTKRVETILDWAELRGGS